MIFSNAFVPITEIVEVRHKITNGTLVLEFVTIDGEIHTEMYCDYESDISGATLLSYVELMQSIFNE